MNSKMTNSLLAIALTCSFVVAGAKERRSLAHEPG